MISFERAVEIIQGQGKERPLSLETVSVSGVPGRICGQDVFSPAANQPFDNSAMDGFALKCEDLKAASADNPVALNVAGHIAAGDVVDARLERGHCVEIMTGAPVPPGCDAVVPVEQARATGDGRVLFGFPARAGDNIRLAGADVSSGEKILERGDFLRSPHILALATLGIREVPVLRKPRMALLSTGREIVDDPRDVLDPGRIYNSTGPYLRAVLPEMGAELTAGSSVGDDADLFGAEVQRAAGAGCDVVVSTGAVSAGAHDFVPSVLKALGAEVFFHKVAIRPGKPVFFAKLPGGAFFFGLPGNPVSTAVGARFFLYPLIRAMQGLSPEAPGYGVLAEDYSGKKKGLRLFLRGASAVRQDGTTGVSLIRKQQSFMVSPFVKSDVWAVIPEEDESLRAGSVVAVYQ